MLSLHPLTRRRGSTSGLAASIAAALLLAVPAVASAADYTWTGATPTIAPEAANWSNPTNWIGGVPSNPVGTLTFPALMSPTCTGEPTTTCYESHNDIAGLNVNELKIDDGLSYFIDGEGIALGAGGLTAFPSANDKFAFPELKIPVTLSAPQTWTIEGGSEIQQLVVNSNISGSNALSVVFAGSTGFPTLDLYEGDTEVGPVTVSGTGEVVVGKSLNGTSESPVTLSEGAGLSSFFGSAVTLGPLTTTENDGVVVGQSFEGGAGTLAAAGNVVFDPSSTFYTYINQPGTVAGTDFSQLSASGEVKLESAHLSLSDGEYFTESGNACESLRPGDVDTLVSATGSLTGKFNGIEDGDTVQVQCFGTGTAPTARINYTAHAVTATILTAGGSPPIPTTTALQISNAAPAIGEAVTYTATVTPKEVGGALPSGSVQFTDGGQPIAGCSAQPLTPSGFEASAATCSLSYADAGTHSIAASYAGAGHYLGSSSAAQTVTVGASATGGGSAPSPAGGTAPPPPSGNVALSKATVVAKPNGQLLVRLGCSGNATCKGTLTLTAKGKAKSSSASASKLSTIGKAPFAIPAGKTATVKLKLNAAGRALLKAHHGKLTATLTIVKSSPSPTSTARKTVHIVQKKR